MICWQHRSLFSDASAMPILSIPDCRKWSVFLLEKKKKNLLRTALVETSLVCGTITQCFLNFAGYFNYSEGLPKWWLCKHLFCFIPPPPRMSGKHSCDISRNRVKNFISLPFQKFWCILVLRKMPEVTLSLFYLQGCFCWWPIYIHTLKE